MNDLSSEEMKKIINGEIEMDKLLAKNTYIQTLIDNYVAESLKNIFLKISEARHGSTLIFNFKGDIDNKELFQPDAIKINIPYGSTLLKLAELKEPNFFYTEESREIFNPIEMYENAIVSLSQTDGAMIFNQNLI